MLLAGAPARAADTTFAAAGGVSNHDWSGFYLGGTAGAALGYVVFNNMTTGTVNWITFSELAFQFRVTPALMGTSMVLATVLGVVGGFFPAFRASLMTIARALRGL